VMTRHHNTVGICLISIVTLLLNNYSQSRVILFFKYFIDIIFHHIIFCYTINNLLKLKKRTSEQSLSHQYYIVIYIYIRITLQR